MVSALVRCGHSVQVLTSNHRLPSQSLPGETGVRRRLILAGDANRNFGSLHRREYANREVLLDSLSAFRPDCAYIWDMRGLSKSLLHHFGTYGIPCLFDLHNTWPLEDLEADPWADWWRGKAGVGRKCQRALMHLCGRSRILTRRYPLSGPGAIDLSNAYVCSDNLRRQLADGGLPVENLKVLHPSTDTNLLPIKISYRSNTRFIWAGRLSDEKDPWTAIEAVRLLRERGIHASLYMFVQGEQIERKRMRNQIDSSGMRDYVFKKYIRPSELPRHLSHYDAFLSTSRATDPFPMTPLEAMLGGMPCILTRCGGLQEIAKEGEHYLGFDAGDAGSLVSAMEKFCEKPDYGAEMGRKCRESLQDKFSMDNQVKEIEQRLEGVISAARDRV